MRSDELSSTCLPRRRIGARYAVAEVDAFLEDCAAALRSGEAGRPTALRSDDIMQQDFPPAWMLTPGYDASAVDALLDRIAVQLRLLEPHDAGRAEQSASDEAALRALLDETLEAVRRKRGER